MYEMLCQTEPYRGRNIKETFDNILNREPATPSSAAPHRTIPLQLEKICLRAMAKHPDDRYTSMRGMLNAINDFRSESLVRNLD